MDKYERSSGDIKLGTTKPGIMRNCFMFNTYDAEFFLDENQKIVGLKSDEINGGEVIGEKTLYIVEDFGVSNIVKHIIENEDYSSLDEFIIELNVAYKEKLLGIINQLKEEKKSA